MLERGQRVKLTVSVYARHFPGLVRGAEGVVAGVNRGGRDDVVQVDFRAGGRRAIPVRYLVPAGDRLPPEARVLAAAPVTPAVERRTAERRERPREEPAARTAATKAAPRKPAAKRAAAEGEVEQTQAAVLEKGPRGGYRSLTYVWEGETVSVKSREAIRNHLKKLRDAGVPVEEREVS